MPNAHGVPKDVLQAIHKHQPIPDAKLAAVAAMKVEMVAKHGQPEHAIVRAFLGAGYQERDLLYIVLAAAVKTMSNYIDEKFAAYKVA